MKAVIMAGGKGTRLRPLTSNQPKPMISIVNKPCMEHIVDLLKRHGFEDVVVTLEYMPEVIQGYFGNGSEWGMNIEYSVEEEPLGTAGSVKDVEDRLKERFVIVSGDALTDVDLTEALSFHEERGAEATLVLKKVDDPSEFGIVTVAEDGRVTDFMEKPDEEEVFSYTANTGIYVLEPSVLKDIPEGQEYDWSKEQFPKMLEEGRSLYGYVMEGYWEDIGNIEQYMGAQRAVLDGEVEGIEPAGERLEGGVYVGRDVRVDEDQLEGPVVLGDNVRVSSGARVGPYSVLASNISVGEGASISRSTVGGESSIGEEAELDGALVMRACNVGPRARVLEGSALGDGTSVGEGATVAPGASVPPGESIDDGAEVTEDAS
ncbi:MAG TPA: NDP-sugar synthase [Rubrobacteraceae bacterium]|jgi:mannose-1-phosphate guanylyltransferase / phosphomannomutase